MSTHDPRAILSYDNRFHVAGGRKPAVFTDVDGSFLSAQPLTHLGRSQLSQFVQFDGSEAELDCQAQDANDNPVEFACDVLGLLGHNLPNGTLIQFLDDAALLAAHTVRPYLDANPHTVVPLPTSVSLDTLTIKITNAGIGRHRISVPWAGPSLRFEQSEGWGFDMRELGQTERSAGNTSFSYRGGTADVLPVTIDFVGEEEAVGMHVRGALLARPEPASWDTNNSSEEDDHRYVFQHDGTLLSEGGFFSGGEWYELELFVEYGAGQGGVPQVAIGTGNTWALQPGYNQIVGTPDDGSNTAFTLLTSGEFTGAITLVAIHQVSERPNAHNIKSTLETAASTEPIIWLPRWGQPWVDRAAIYGKLDRPGRVDLISGPWWRAQFGIRQEGKRSVA